MTDISRLGIASLLSAASTMIHKPATTLADKAVDQAEIVKEASDAAISLDETTGPELSVLDEAMQYLDGRPWMEEESLIISVPASIACFKSASGTTKQRLARMQIKEKRQEAELYRIAYQLLAEGKITP